MRNLVCWNSVFYFAGFGGVGHQSVAAAVFEHFVITLGGGYCSYSVIHGTWGMRDRNFLDISDVFITKRSEISLILFMFMLLPIVLNLWSTLWLLFIDSVCVLRDYENLCLQRSGPLDRSGCQVHRPFHNGRIISNISPLISSAGSCVIPPPNSPASQEV